MIIKLIVLLVLIVILNACETKYGVYVTNNETGHTEYLGQVAYPKDCTNVALDFIGEKRKYSYVCCVISGGHPCKSKFR